MDPPSEADRVIDSGQQRDVARRDQPARARLRPQDPARPTHDAAALRARRRNRRLRQELAARGSVAFLLLAFNEVLGRADPLIRMMAMLGLLLNGPYYLLARTGRWTRPQAYARMLLDIAFITLGLYSAGGLAAAPYLSVYMIVTVYSGIGLSTTAAAVGATVAAVSYLGMVFLQHVRWLPATAAPPPDPWTVVAFNILVLVVVSVTTAILAAARRRSRGQLVRLYEELERAHDEAVRFSVEVQRAGRLHVLGEVLAGVTHEIRNALTAAVGHIHFAREKARGGAPEVVRHIDTIGHSVDATMRILQNVLQTARDAGAETAPVSIPEIVRRLAELKTFDLRRDGITLRIDFPSDFPLVRGAPLQILQVLLNLVGNAQDALHGAPGPRVVSIVGLADDAHAIVEVRDTGPGLPPEILTRLFEPFATTKAHGTGLGLAISAGIVRDLGGELTAKNALEGGAVFRLTLPASPGESTPQGGRLETPRPDSPAFGP